MAAPYVIPVTTAPAQLVSVNLGGQDVLLNIYAKSINVPAQAGSAFVSNALVGIAYGAALDGNIMTVTNPVVGSLAAGNFITGTGLAQGATITSLAEGTTGGVGTYYINPAATPTASARVTAYAPTQSPSNQIIIDPSPYVNINPVFIDLYLNDTLVVGGVLLRNKNRVVRNTYFGFVGDIVVIDTAGDEDPYGVPPTLPPVALMNKWQRDLPLSLQGKAPPTIAGTIPGFGTRFLLTWWPDLT